MGMILLVHLLLLLRIRNCQVLKYLISLLDNKLFILIFQMSSQFLLSTSFLLAHLPSSLLVAPPDASLKPLHRIFGIRFVQIPWQQQHPAHKYFLIYILSSIRTNQERTRKSEEAKSGNDFQIEMTSFAEKICRRWKSISSFACLDGKIYCTNSQSQFLPQYSYFTKRHLRKGAAAAEVAVDRDENFIAYQCKLCSGPL